MEDDLENSRLWLDRLQELNAVIEATGEPLMGNLFYDHHQSDFTTSPPNAILRPKRDRFRQALVGRRCLLEIGVNGGHSAFLALTSNPDLVFHGVDICHHSYVRPAIDWLAAEFPGRVEFWPGDCLKVVPGLSRQPARFDAFHIDGAKHTYLRDIVHCHPLADRSGATVVIDDIQNYRVKRAWDQSLRFGILGADPRFPPMDAGIKHRQVVGTLQPASPGRIAVWRSWARFDGRSGLAQRVEHGVSRLSRGHAGDVLKRK